MIGQTSAAMQRTAPKRDLFHAAAHLVTRDEYGTLILDRLGRIRGCGAPAEKIFGASQVRLIGRWISEFVGGLLLGGSSPSYSARYLVYLSADGQWRKFAAKDVDGREFAVELKLARTIAEGEEVFLLNVHRPGDETCR